MGRRLVFVSSLAAGLCATLHPASAQTLEAALVEAYRSNPTVRAERARYRATKELKPQAWANALPQITASASIENLDQDNNSSFSGEGDFDFEPRSAQVSAEQPLFTGLRNFNAIRQARARVRAGAAQLIAAEQQVLQDAATAYFDVIREMQVYEANLSNVKVLLRQQEEARLRFEVGEITRTDVAQADARLAGARAQLASSQAQLAVSRSRYREVVGSAPGTLDDDPPMPDVPQTEEEAQNFARVYAPAIIAAKQTETASRRQIAIARGVLAPTLSLTARYQYAEEPNFFVNQDEQLAYGARASIPIFQGGLNYSRIREAKALNDADRQRIDEAERTVAASVTAAWEQLVAARVTITSARAQVDANTLALEGVRRENQVGARTTLDVLNAEQELLNANVSLANAERDERGAVFALLAAAGLLTPETAGLPSLGENEISTDAAEGVAEVIEKTLEKTDQ